MGLQGQRNVYQTKLQRCQDQMHGRITNEHVPCANDPGRVNIVTIIEKNITPEEDEF